MLQEVYLLRLMKKRIIQIIKLLAVIQLIIAVQIRIKMLLKLYGYLKMVEKYIVKIRHAVAWRIQMKWLWERHRVKGLGYVLSAQNKIKTSGVSSEVFFLCLSFKISVYEIKNWNKNAWKSYSPKSVNPNRRFTGGYKINIK